jgi:hypothetical protein
MGAKISKVTADLEVAKKAQTDATMKMKAQLAQLAIILNAKEEQYKMLLVTDNSADKMIPIDTIIKMQSEKCVNVSSGPSQALDDMVSDLFGGNFLGALRGVIMGALDTVMGSAASGEKEKIGMTVMLLHSAVVRVDYMIYSYTLTSSGVVDTVENGMCFVCTLSTVKLSKVNPEAIALLAGITAEQSLAFLDKLRRKYADMSYRIKRDEKYYSVAEAVGLIRGYFWNNLDDKQKTLIGGFLTSVDQANVKDAIGDTTDVDAGAGTVAEDAAKVAANKMLLSLLAENAVEKSDDAMIEQQQTELLDAMIRIYKKIAQMKRSTAVSIRAAEGIGPVPVD